MQNFGLVSIITPSYNCSKFIGETIESIQSQTYQNWELLITDDCSSDMSCEVIEQYASKDQRIKLLRLTENSGAGVARNNSIKEAKGRFIAFCDSDDRWYPEKLEKQLAFMESNGCVLSYTSYDVCDEEGDICGFVKCRKYINRARILQDNGIGCLSAIYNAEATGKYFMPKIRKRQDWCLWINIISDHKQALGIMQPLALYRDRSKSISSNKIEMLKYNYRVYRDVLKYNPITSFTLLMGYFMPYYFYKKVKQKIDYKKRIKQK